MAAAADADREHVGHPEVRAHAADLDLERGLPREAVRRARRHRSSCRRRRSPRSPPGRRGAPRRASSSSGRRRRSHRVALGVVGVHQRAVVLAEEERRARCRARRAPRGSRRRSSGRPASRRQALRIVAFSRSSRPIRPISCERLTASVADSSSRDHRRGRRLELGVDRREDRRDRDRARCPGARMSSTARRSSSGSSSRDRPAVELVAAVAEVAARRRRPPAAVRASRPSAAALASPGSPSRIAAVGCSRLPSTTAFVKCVVPIITAWIAVGRDAAPARRGAERRTMPVVTSAVVAVFTSARTSLAVHQDRVRVRAADVDADAPPCHGVPLDGRGRRKVVAGTVSWCIPWTLTRQPPPNRRSRAAGRIDTRQSTRFRSPSPASSASRRARHALGYSGGCPSPAPPPSPSSTSRRSRPARPSATRCATRSISRGTSSDSAICRHWVAEHHNMPGIASSAPAVLIAHLAGATTTHPRRRRAA